MAEAQEPSAVLMPTEGREPSDRALKPTPAAALEPSAANPTSEAMEQLREQITRELKESFAFREKMKTGKKRYLSRF